MTILALSPLATSTQPNVMETIMKPLSYARRGARWLMAAGIAVAMLGSTPGFTEDLAAKTSQAANPDPGLDLDNSRIINPEPGRVVPFFTKTGGQRGCDYVEYSLSFGLRGDPQSFADPNLIASLKATKLDFKDQLPHGLRIVNVQVSGDGTDASGGSLPAAAISTSASPDDTAGVSDFRISATDLDGLGGANERVINFRITAKIDHAAFPSPTTVDNQGIITVAKGGGTGTIIPSQDPSKPDDGNILTGVKTSIRIDVTKCNPPPPPQHECFKIERGTVDCVPGGGAFIYHMPVGPEMGGKWIQLSTTTPGITIIPDTQQVPAGGGVLNWKIVGASPGETIHIIVIGINSYAGPKEGWGLCCTQTIDIVIPPDLKCPPRDKEPDLKVEKHADVPRCTMAGGCDFTIRVTNVGTAPYNGKIVLDEVTLPAGSTIDSGPNAPWVCTPTTSPMICTYPVTTLNPGAFVDLKIGFKPAPGWQGHELRNCATYDYGASGKPLFGSQQNDRGCASIPICQRGDRDRDCQPPVEKKVDLILKKRARGEVCTTDGVCTFVIDVINNGTAAYSGPLTVTDTYPGGAPASSTFGPTPPWTCGPSGPGQFRCDDAGITLVPGASTSIVVRATMPAGYRSDTVENCAEVKPIPGETDLSNNKACAAERIRHPNGGSSIRVEKTGDSTCQVGRPCSFTITITNDGPGPFSGPVRIGDAIGVDGLGRLDGVAITSIDPPFGCSPEPATLPASCIANLSLGAGESHVHHVTTVIPDDGRLASLQGTVNGQNCVGVLPPDTPVQGGGGDVLPGNATNVQGDRGKAYACHPFTITHEVKQGCSAGFVMNDAGNCVCPQGTSFRNGQCSSGGGINLLPLPIPQRCVLLPGQVRTTDGQCICPRGNEVRNGRCAPSNQQPSGQCNLLPGQYRNQDGDCVCRQGVVVNGACQVIKQECTVRGSVPTPDGSCTCPDGTHRQNRACVPDRPKSSQCTLLRGQVRTQDGSCVCPDGTQLRGRACVPVRSVEQCDIRGQVHGKGGACICPRGTQVVDGACRRPLQECAPGARMINGHCQPVGGRRFCPPGTVGRFPNCIPGRRNPSMDVNPGLLLNPNLQQPRRPLTNLQ